MKITVFAIGRPKSRAVQELVADYAERLTHYLPFEIKACRDEKQALGSLDPQDFFVVLDERGLQKSSMEMADFISEHQRRGTKRIVFFVGGEAGIGEIIMKRSDQRFSLSRMTYPHELVQVVLAEQLYRACTIIRGEPYHK
ncbi:MAG: 23S rRNA (pseudouridine(1915)-N(3))-methyltransferase RlmH [Pseudomonadota bacterium]